MRATGGYGGSTLPDYDNREASGKPFCFICDKSDHIARNCDFSAKKFSIVQNREYCKAYKGVHHRDKKADNSEKPVKPEKVEDTKVNLCHSVVEIDIEELQVSKPEAYLCFPAII
jgi:viroplasmin and RNaseH domain-containing protein